MFNCYVHGWSSHVYTCPACTNFVTSSSSSVPDYIVGISGHELSKLKEENARLREALDTIAFRSEPKANTPDFWLGLSHEECAETVAEDTDCARAALEEK